MKQIKLKHKKYLDTNKPDNLNWKALQSLWTLKMHLGPVSEICGCM